MTSVRLPLFLSISLIFICLSLTPSLAFAQKERVAIIFDKHNKTFSFTANEMKKNMEKGGYIVTLADIGSLKNTKAQNRFVLTVRGTAEANNFLNERTSSPLPTSKSQGYSVRKKTGVGYNDWCIIGFDTKGVIYGGLDVSETINLKGFETLAEVDKEPYINNRGIKFNIPLDARTPSYSDNADAAQQNIANMWDVNFWHEFLDEMARDRFNMLSLWSLSPFPSMVDVPEYPNAGLNDVKKTTSKLLPTTDAWYMSTLTSLGNLATVKKITLAEKIEFWKAIMQYASDRGIDCYLFTWNLFTYGTENSGYGFTDKITDSKTKNYIRKATKALIKTYPLLKGIGLTAGENMYKLREVDKEKFLYESYGEGINDALEADPERAFKLIHRAHQADINNIKTAFSGLNPKCTMDFSYKYSVAQMYSAVAPKYIYESEFLDHIGNSKFFLTVRDDAWYYLRGGSDPAFAREYFKNIPKNNFEGFYLGPDGYTWGREYISKTPDSPNQLVLKKRWYSFQILGKLAYDPNTPDSHFVDLLDNRFPEVNAKKLHEAWAIASQIMPWVNRFHNEKAQNDFQWYPEGCTSFYGFRTINSFINSAPQKGEDLISIPAYSDAVLNGKNITGITPIAVAENLQKISDHALLLVAGMTNIKVKELRQTIADIKAMSFLGGYYSKKILGAAYKDLYDKATIEAQKIKYKNAAIKNLQDASNKWRKYASQVASSYIPQHLTRMHFTIDFKAMQAHVDKEVTMLDSRLPVAGLNMKPPIQQLEVVFSNNSNYYFWHLDKLGLPANWSSFKYLVLEVFATSKQPFDLILQTDRDTIVRKGINPTEKGWTRIVVPLETITAQIAKKQNIVTNYHEAAYSQLLLNEVSGLGVSIEKPVGYPVLEIRSIKLSKEEPGDTAFTLAQQASIVKNGIGSHNKRKIGDPLENLPENIEVLTHFGERADISPDNNRIAFMSKSFGDAMVIDVKTRGITCLTCNLPASAFLRVMHLSTGDYLLIGPDHFENISISRKNSDLWFLSKEPGSKLIKIGQTVNEGVAISKKSLKVAFTEIGAGVSSKLVVADLDIAGGIPKLINKKTVIESADTTCRVEAQDFYDNDTKMTFFCYVPNGAFEVNGVDLQNNQVTNYSKAPGSFNEPEGIFPGGKYTTVETDRQCEWLGGQRGSANLDIWKLKLDGIGKDFVRLTHFNDYEGGKASNPVVSRNGKFMAFQAAKSTDPPGIGHGLLLYWFRE